MFEQKTRGNLIEKISSNVKIVKPKSISLSNWYGKALLAVFVGLVMIGASLNAEAQFRYGYGSTHSYRHRYHQSRGNYYDYRYDYGRRYQHGSHHYGRIFAGYGFHPIAVAITTAESIQGTDITQYIQMAAIPSLKA